MRKMLQKTLALVLLLMLAMPTMVFAETGNVGYFGWNDQIQFTNATHYTVDTFEDIPSTPEHYMVMHGFGSNVSFANAPTTLTIVGTVWLGDIIPYAEQGFSSLTEYMKNAIVNELIFPDGVTLMDYLKPSQDFFGSDRSFSELRPEYRPIPLENLQHDGLDVLSGSIILQEGIYAVRVGERAGMLNVLVVGNADTSVLQAYNQTGAPALITAPNLSAASTWAHEDINNAVVAGLVPQSLQNHYTNNITRAEFAALAVALYEAATGAEITGRMQFNDTDDTNVQMMGYLGVVTGVGDDRFDPDGQLSREQAAVMLARLANALGQPLPQYSSTFADNNQISDWAIQAVGQIQASGIMGGVGDNRFAPQGDYTREQSIVTVVRLFEMLD